MDKILLVYWFAIIVIASVALAYGTSIFYSKPYDVRNIEANLLAIKASDCISYGGKINKEIFFNGSFNDNLKSDFKSICGVNFEDKDEKEIQYYIRVEFFNFSSTEPIFYFDSGNINLGSDCEIQKTDEYRKLAKCESKKLYAVDDEDKQYLIKIVSAVNKADKNVK